MGESEEKLLSHHFSHQHPLTSTSSPPKGNTTCFGCRLNIFPGKEYFKCKTCTFSLHQVCHNMPKKVQHPADPDHHFTLQAMPKSAKGSFNCKACGHQIVGFYYNCAKCGDYYHILCSVVPLSVKMPSHIHRLKLEFSPPYDFQCDLCKKPSYSSWLYRCGLCEFDAHLACAITNNGAKCLQHQSAPTYISLQIDRNIDCRSKGNELMELITQGMKGPEIVPDQSQAQDQFSLLSEDQTIPSYQFSDACFSIDFAKSLLGDEYTSQVSREADHQNKMEDTPEFRVKNNHSYKVLSNGTMDHMKQANQAPTLANKAGFGAHIWMELGQESEKRKANGTRDRTDDIESTKSDPENLGSSCWSRLLLCLYYPRTDRGTEIFKNGSK